MRHLIGVNKTRDLAGQRRFSNDDFEVLSDHFYEGFQRQFIEYSPCVISGCKVSGTTGNYQISEGLVFINNKMIFFPGASGYDIKANTYLVEGEPVYESERPFDSISEERAGIVRYTANLTETSYSGEGIQLTNLGPERTYQKLFGDRIYTQQYARISNDIVVPGTIIMWSGVLDNFDDTGKGINIMTGWALCNGNNSTPNLKGRFVVGYDKDVASYNSVGKTGGESSVSLGVNHIPKHRHVPTPGEGEFGLVKRSVSGFTTTAAGTDSSGSGTQPDVETAPGADQEVGGNQAHENRPPYYVIAYLMKTGSGAISVPPPVNPNPNPNPNPTCNLTQGQILGVWSATGKKTEVMYHQNQYWPWYIHKETTPKRAYVRGVNFLTFAEFTPSGTLPNIECFAPYETDFNGLAHPSQFNGAPNGWQRTTDEGGYVCFDEIIADPPPAGGSGSGDINGSITFETTVI